MDNLVGGLMDFQTDVRAGRNGHNGHLQIVPCPKCGAEGIVLKSFGGRVGYVWSWPAVVFAGRIGVGHMLPRWNFSINQYMQVVIEI